MTIRNHIAFRTGGRLLATFRHWLWPLIIVLAMAISLPAFADYFAKAKQAYEATDYKSAVRMLRPLARKGDPRAQLLLGSAYFSGEGVGFDFKKARYWLERAVAQNHTPAFAPLGQLLLKTNKGRDERGLDLIRTAVGRGDAQGQLALGWLYFVGQGGVATDLEKSRRLLLKSAEQKHKLVFSLLTFWYASDRGKKPDNVEALKWAIIDTRIGVGVAADIHRAKALKALTKDQIAEAKRRAAAWLKVHWETP